MIRFLVQLVGSSMNLVPIVQVSAEYDEPLRIELLQLATLLLKYLQNDLVHHRKELIKFGWNHLKREDTASKQWAFVNVCHFLEAYQAPEKIILQVLKPWFFLKCYVSRSHVELKVPLLKHAFSMFNACGILNWIGHWRGQCFGLQLNGWTVESVLIKLIYFYINALSPNHIWGKMNNYVWKCKF